MKALVTGATGFVGSALCARLAASGVEVVPAVRSKSGLPNEVVVGNLDVVDGVDNSKLAFKRQSLSGSLIGNLQETQDVLDFCAANGIAPEIEIVDIADINEVYTRIENGEVRYRAVIDMASLS